jgi:hypothetical protein
METGYIFFAEGGRGVDVLPILINQGSWVCWNDYYYEVTEYISREQAGLFVDLEDFEDVDVWLVCMEDSSRKLDLREIIREIKINELL